jgi:arsenite-transporting ATPase
MSANLFGLNVDLAVINKIMPSTVSDPYFSELIRQQQILLRDAEVNFYPIPIKKARLFANELKGIDMLNEYAYELFSNEDPSRIIFNEDVFSFSYSNDTFSVRMKVPFTSKDDFELERIGDQLIVRIRGSVGNIVNIIPLPSAIIGMRLDKARLQDSMLIITFKREINR